MKKLLQKPTISAAMIVGLLFASYVLITHHTSEAKFVKNTATITENTYDKETAAEESMKEVVEEKTPEVTEIEKSTDESRTTEKKIRPVVIPPVSQEVPVLTGFTPSRIDWQKNNMNVSISYAAQNGANMTKIQYCWQTEANGPCIPGSTGWNYTYTCNNTVNCTAAIVGRSEGSYYLCSKGVDTNGNTSATTCKHPYRKDITAPTITSLTNVPSDWTNVVSYAETTCTDPSNPRGNAGCEDYAMFYMKATNPGTCVESMPYNEVSPQPIVGHTWICARQWDKALNTSVPFGPVEYKIDRRFPDAPALTVTNDNPYCATSTTHYTHDSSWDISWTDYPTDEGDSGVEYCGVVVHAAGPNFGTSCMTPGTYTFDYPSLGSSLIYSFAQDRAGNRDESSQLEMVYDTLPPTNGAIQYPNGNTNSSITITTVSGSDEYNGSGTANASANCPNNAYAIQYATASLQNNTCQTFGAWTIASQSANPINSFTFTGQTNRCYKFRYIVHDKAGNQKIYTNANIAKVAEAVTNHAPAVTYVNATCDQISIGVHDEDVQYSSDYVVDVYLDSDASSATRFGRYYDDSIMIDNTHALFPNDPNVHSIIIWIVDFDSNGDRINNGVNGWVGPYTYSWNRSSCSQATQTHIDTL